MYRVLDETSGNAVGIKVEGTLTREDYEMLVPYLERLIAESGPINLVCEMSQFTGMDVGAFWEDFKFSLHHLKDFRRIAIVGGQAWLEWMAKGVEPFLKTELRCFPSTDYEQAWNWVRS
ncbi:MAG: STAS/SEC14 domain-containing protein [Nitrospirae bacterium]|nr:MAG: STAS/SEC14 domain-containing protein [Nitrospirota bacterium]